MKKSLILASVVLGVVALTAPFINNALALSSEQEQVISGECDTIHQILQALQKTDSKTRVKLGYTYENILSKYMIPLSSRLAKNSISNSEFVDIQSAFKDAKQNFSNDFIVYQKNLENLVIFNCTENPKEFYSKLQTLRSDREKVRQDTLVLSNLIKKHQSVVIKMLETLWQKVVEI